MPPHPVLSSSSRALAAVALAAGIAAAQGPENVLLVINDNAAVSRTVGEYYARRRAIPARNVCRIRTTADEEIPRSVYDRQIAPAVAGCLRSNHLTEQVLYIVTTLGVPLRIAGTSGQNGDVAAVDSELALLYSDMRQPARHSINGRHPNPFFAQKEARFAHPQFPMYLVTRLAAYDFPGVKNMIDRALLARNQGKFVLDGKSSLEDAGNGWLLSASLRLPQDRVVLDRSPNVLYDQTGVIGYASWGSNDSHRHRRFSGFRWLPGAIATEFVSTDGRTFRRPPETWTISDWNSPNLWFAGSPQTLTADFLLEGATGASGHVAEPYLSATPRPDFLLPAYFSGRNLAESYYLSIPYLSWQNIVVGDPLCSLGTPR